MAKLTKESLQKTYDYSKGCRDDRLAKIAVMESIKHPNFFRNKGLDSCDASLAKKLLIQYWNDEIKTYEETMSDLLILMDRVDQQ